MFRMQCKVMLHKKEIWLAFLISMVYAIYSFVDEYRNPMVENVSGFWHYCGMGDSYHWMQFTTILCFLVAIPAMSFQNDISDHMLAVICVRENRKAYFKAKMKVVFWTEFMMVVLPFLINLILCLVSFKHIYSYYPSPYGGIENTDITVYSDPTFARGTTVPFVWLFKKCPVLYVVLFLLFLGCFVGALGLFLLALSFWLPRVKILLFLPVFGLTKLGSVLSGWSYQRYLENHQYLYINFNLWHYVSPISYDGKVYGIFLLGVLFLCGFIFVSYRMICRKEYTDA